MQNNAALENDVIANYKITATLAIGPSDDVSKYSNIYLRENKVKPHMKTGSQMFIDIWLL